MSDAKNKDINETEDYNRMVNGNTILLSLEGWIKFVEGFTKGLSTTDKVSSDAVLDVIGEIMEYMNSFRSQIMSLFLHCEDILEENENLKAQIEQLKTNQVKLITSDELEEINHE